MRIATEVDAAGKNELNLCLNILVIGKLELARVQP